MEPENDPIEKENHLPNLHFWVPNHRFRKENHLHQTSVIIMFQPLIFQGVEMEFLFLLIFP